MTHKINRVKVNFNLTIVKIDDGAAEAMDTNGRIYGTAWDAEERAIIQDVFPTAVFSFCPNEDGLDCWKFIVN